MWGVIFMVFSSLLFILLFLPLNLICYFFVQPKNRNMVMLVFSLIFYSWGGPRYLLLLLADTFLSWFFALMIERSDGSARKGWLIAECVSVLGILGVFKYSGFFLSTIFSLTGIPGVVPQIVLPIGISFYTFQLLSYVIDVYRGEIDAQPVYWKVLLYASLFHQCIAGPIVRYETVAHEIDHRRVNHTDVFAGIRRFSIGLAKKAILANSCATVADTLLPAGVDGLSRQTTLGLWLGLLFYMLQIYLDFSAYSDMAIGMGRMIGFHYLENFNYPYIARSVQDFWRRWHISLSTFFRDYVYIPLGGSRCTKGEYLRNMAVVWFLTGLWHGASWNFILWGLYYLVFLLLERFVIRKRMPEELSHVYTLLVVYFGWLIFRFENLGEIGVVLKGMFGFAGGGFTSMEVGSLFLGNLLFLLFAIIAVTPFGKWLRRYLFALGSRRNQNVFVAASVIEAVTPVILLILSVLSLIGDSYNPFLYFRF